MFLIMKKKLFFEPTKNTNLPEYITIEYGKIRTVNILQLASEVPKLMLEHEPSLNKDAYLPLKGFDAPLNLKRVDKYLSKLKGLKYTHEVLLPDLKDLNGRDMSKLPPSEYILKSMIRNRKIFIKLNFIELLIIDYDSSSWNNLNDNQKISIIGIAIATIIAVLIFVLNLILTSFFG